ncbi:hypothetical protein HPC49_53275, partial [Pyxidicoccus fallax]
VWTEEHPFETSLRESAAPRVWRGNGHVRAEELARVGWMSVGRFYRHHGSKAGFAWRVRQWAEADLCRAGGGGGLRSRRRANASARGRWH